MHDQQRNPLFALRPKTQAKGIYIRQLPLDILRIFVHKESSHGSAPQWPSGPGSRGILPIIVKMRHMSQLVIVIFANGRVSFVVTNAVVPGMDGAGAARQTPAIP